MWVDVLGLGERETSGLLVCSDHFDDSCFNNPDDRQNSRLNPSACPKIRPVKPLKRIAEYDIFTEEIPTKHIKEAVKFIIILN